jgi:outer membrane protein assembly factor BamB
MQSVQIIVGQTWKQDVRFLKNLRRYHRFHSELDLVEIRDVIDIVVDGTNITSNIAEESIFGVLDGLLDAVAQLLEGRLNKAIIEFHCEPWEMVLQPRGQQFLISLYGIDRHHRVIAHDIEIGIDTFVEALSSAAESLLGELYRISESFSTDSFVRAFSSRLRRIQDYKRSEFTRSAQEEPESRGTHQAGTSSASGWTLSYRFDADYRGLRDYCGEHEFDLHALLCPGEITAEADGQTVLLTRELREKSSANSAPSQTPDRGYPLLTTHALLKRCRQLLNLLEAAEDDSFECAEPMRHLNLEVSARGSDWTILLGPAGGDEPRLEVRSAPRETLDLLLSLSELLLADVLSLNPLMELNNRWSDLDDEARELRGWFENLSGSNSYHDEPEHYIEALGHVLPTPTPGATPPEFPWPLASVRALFPQPAWQFAAEIIEFRSIIAAPGAVLVPSSEAMYLLDAERGRVRWKRSDVDMNRLSHAVVGDRLLLAEDGRGVESIDLESGRQIFKNRSADTRSWKRLIGTATYAAENRLVACDAQGRILGLSSDDGQVLWSFAPGHGRFVGVSFWGPLITALTGEGFLFTINPIDGKLLWKIRLGGLADSEPQFHQGRLYALSHDSLHQKLTVHSLYPFTGRTSWQLRIDGVLAGQACFVDEWMIIPVEHHGQLSLRGIDVERSDPRVEWTLELSSAGMNDPTRVLSVLREPTEDQPGAALGLVKTDRAEISCFEIATGELVWRVTPEDEIWLLHGNVPLSRVEDAILAVGEDTEFRDIATGRLLHTLDQPVKAPEYVLPFGELSVLVGARGSSSDSVDVLSCLKLNHFLARVK